jgi:hypothetical protein
MFFSRKAWPGGVPQTDSVLVMPLSALVAKGFPKAAGSLLTPREVGLGFALRILDSALSVLWESSIGFESRPRYSSLHGINHPGWQ